VGGTSNEVDNEAKGEDAYDRISRSARDSYRATVRRATKAAYRSHNTEAQSKPGALTKPSVKPRKSAEKSDAPRRSGTRSTNNEEEHDIAEAIARSLGDTVGDPDDLDMAKAKVMSLFSGTTSATPAAGRRSYRSTGSSSTSSATAPHTPLQSLLDDMGQAAKSVEESDPDELARHAPELASVIRKWQNTVADVLQDTEAAEYKRIQDVQGHLDHDQDIEDKHRRKMNVFSKQCGDQMLRVQQDHQKELEKQKQAYEAYILQHVVQNSPPQLFGHASPPMLTPPMPPMFRFTAGGRGHPPVAQSQMHTRSTLSDPGLSSEGSKGWSRKRAKHT
jgi:hypothetical protein